MESVKPKFTAIPVLVGAGKTPVKTGILHNKTVNRENLRRPDINDLCNELADAYNQLDADGYEVVNLLPINIGELLEGPDKQNSIGISVTRGAIVIGRLNAVEIVDI